MLRMYGGNYKVPYLPPIKGTSALAGVLAVYLRTRPVFGLWNELQKYDVSGVAKLESK